MKKITDFLTSEQTEQLKRPEVAEQLAKLADQMQKHHNNTVYTEARELYEQTQERQINKGAEKYPEPLNPDSWSMKELEQHAFDEVVDLTHYIAAMRIKSTRLERDLEAALHIVSQAGQQIKDHYKEVEHWRVRAVNAERERNELARRFESLEAFNKNMDMEG